MFKSIYHFFAKVLKTVVGTTETVVKDAEAVGITPGMVAAGVGALVGPGAGNVADQVFALAGEVVPQIVGLSAEEKAKGYSVFLSPEVLAIVGPVIGELEKIFGPKPHLSAQE